MKHDFLGSRKGAKSQRNKEILSVLASLRELLPISIHQRRF
jgi:hypothetical protein